MPRTHSPKKSRPAKRPASKGKEAAPAAERKQERPELPKAHEIIVSAVADMLTHGGPATDVDRLITAGLRHHWRTRLADLGTADEERNVEEFARNAFDTWKQDLAVYWQRNRRSEPGSFDAGTIKDRIRENVRDSLWSECINFINDAAPEEQFILNEILSMWRSFSHGATLHNDEISLGDAFNEVLGQDGTLIKVPRRMIDQVQKYVDALRAVEGKAA